jgi:Histidine kinase-, DNA gyrase B-, and HSP90-like ATPase
MNNWSETDLVLTLRGRHTAASEAILGSLNDSLPEIETILRAGGTAPIRFTLHDSDHSFRVAQMMASLAGEHFLQSCSEIEIAMLLLAAYSHDIGMTPERNLAKRHWDYLITGNKDLLSSEEQSELQLWLDAEWQAKEPPFQTGQLTSEGLDEAEAIYSFYCRHKHNDWSALWITQHLATKPKPIYSGWTQDLITLCKSHHEGLASLRSSKFDARLIGNPGKTLNLRYLAALLRLADILEFDPERTPEIILKHRDIPASSRIFWYRDHGVGLRLDETTKQLFIAARTPNALIHRAVLDIADAIDQELSLCAILEKEGAFRQGSVPEQERELYRWNWAPRLSRDVAERDSLFVYIDGTFRPNSKKILELLSGTQLYGTALAALRELLQNAADAVREQIAHERLAKDTPGDPELEAGLSQIHKIQIVLEKGDDGRLWLRCLDDGVGMTRQIIERHLLISGSTTRAEVRALERSARNFGFSVGRTGQFGIGVLSYFMIADRVEILTRRSTEAGDADGNGWKFVTEGIGEFGQLEPIQRGTNGTEIKLRLRERLPYRVESWESAIHSYCKKILVFTPCRIEFRENLSGQQWRVGPGWTWTPELDGRAGLEEQFAELIHDQDETYQTTLQKERRRSIAESWRKIRSRVVKQLRWIGPVPVKISQYGDGRGWVPYFEIGGEASLIYLDDEAGYFQSLPDDHDFIRCNVKPRISWKGFSIDYIHSDLRGVFIEANLTEGLDPSINREKLTGPETGNLTNALGGAARKSLSAFFDKFSHSRFNAINLAISRYGENTSALGAYWIQTFRREDPGKLLPLNMPCVDLSHLYDFQLREGEYCWLGQRVAILKKVTDGRVSIQGMRLQDGRLALIRLAGFPNVAPVWFWDGGNGVVPTGHNYCERFPPPTWSKLFTVTIGELRFFNRDHDWVKFAARKRTLKKLVNAKDYAGALASAAKSKEDAIHFLFDLVCGGPSDLYIALSENHSDDLRDVIRSAGIDDKTALYGWSTDRSTARDLSERNFTWVFNASGFATKPAIRLSDALEFADGTTIQFPDASWWVTQTVQE